MALEALVMVAVAVGDGCTCVTEVAWVNMGVGRLKEETVVLVVDGCESDERERLTSTEDKEAVCVVVRGRVVDVVAKVVVLLVLASISAT